MKIYSYYKISCYPLQILLALLFAQPPILILQRELERSESSHRRLGSGGWGNKESKGGLEEGRRMVG